MHSSLARSASVAVTCILTGALIVGCASSRSVPGVASGASQPELRHLVRPPTLAQPALAIGNEMMTASGGVYHCYSGRFSEETTFDVSGAAQGPYPGKFHASGMFTTVAKALTSFSESFTITSHKKTITGSFVWNGKSVFAFCHHLSQSTNFTYTATLMRSSKVIKQFSGSASESGIGINNLFGETLI
jgi:hypothetical protein